MKPLVGYVEMAWWALGMLVAIVAVTWYAERRRDDTLYVDEEPVPDDRSSIETHRRLLDTRDAA